MKKTRTQTHVHQGRGHVHRRGAHLRHARRAGSAAPTRRTVPKCATCASASSRSPTARSIVMAHELGFFKKFGINSVISKEASWAVIRDKLSLGENQATHMLIGMPLASTMGLAGSPVKPMVIPWLLNRNGQAITLNNKLKAAGAKTPAQIKPLADKAKAAGEPLTFAMTFPPGHARDVDPLLACVGRHQSGQGRDADHHPAGADGRQHEGGQDGRLLRRRAVEQPGDRGRHRLHRGHDASSCGRTTRRRSAPSPRSSRTKNPKTVKAVLKALHLASVELDKMENRAKFAEVIARPTYINCPPSTILERLMGKYEYGDGRVEQDPNYMIFSNRNCNYPHQIYGKWWLTQFRRWGMVKTAPDYTGVAEAGAALGPVPRGDEGARGRDEGRRGTEDHALRRRVRRDEPREVRDVVQGAQHGGHFMKRLAAPAAAARRGRAGAPRLVGRQPAR